MDVGPWSGENVGPWYRRWVQCGCHAGKTYIRVNGKVNYDVIVVGGGPAGCAVARDMAVSGFRVLVLEEHRHIGEPVQCAGIVSLRTLDLAKVSRRVVLHALKGMHVHSPLGTILELAGHRTYAVAVDRGRFDQELAAQAAGAGAVIICNLRVRDIAVNNRGVRVSACRGAGREEFYGRLLIGADGFNSLVASRLGLASPVEKVAMYAAEVEVPRLQQSLMHVFLGRETAPGWFAWLVPAGAGRARVGTGVSGILKRRSFHPKRLFDDVQKNHPDFFGDMRVVHSTGGWVPVGYRRKTYGNRVMLVGDAACQVKPVSGGGIYLGLKGAAHCARVAAAALQSDRLDDLSGYQKAWEQDFGEEIRSGLKYRQAFLGFSDRDMEFLVRYLNKPSWQRMILRYGDIDHPSRVGEKLSIAGPWAERLAPAALGLIIKGCSTLAGI